MSTKKRAVVHYGLHKTGSTSVQQTAAKHAAYLQENGWLYPRFRYGNSTVVNHSIPLFILFSDNAPRYHIVHKYGWNLASVRNAFQRQLSEILKSADNLLLSGEDLSRLKPRELGQLQTTLLEAGYAVENIAFIRSPLDTCSTVIQQRVKGGKSIDQTLDESTFANFRTIQIIEKLSQELAPFEMHSFDFVCRWGGPYSFLLERLGLPVPRNLPSVTANVSCSMEAVRLMSWINQRLPLLGPQGINPSRRKQDLKPLFDLPGKKFSLLQNEIAPHLPALNAEHADLISRWNLDFVQQHVDENAFPASFCWNDDVVTNLIPLLSKLPTPIFVRIIDFVYGLFANSAISVDSYRDFCAVAREQAACH